LEWAEINGYTFNDLFRIKEGNHPIIVRMVLQRIISLETFIILDRILGCGFNFNKRLTDIIWKDFWMKICKYSPFININLEKCKKLLREKIKREYKYAICGTSK